jgi:phage shock protein C
MRARHDRRFLGVCGGIAHTYGLDPTLVRVATVVLAIVIPGCSVLPTLLVYFLLALAMPVSDEF